MFKSKFPNTSSKYLASKLLELGGIENSFNKLIKQIIHGRRQFISTKIANNSTLSPNDMEENLLELNQTLLVFEQNMRSYYQEFFDINVDFYVENIPRAELLEYVEVIKNESIQKYFYKLRSIEDDAEFIFGQFAQKMIQLSLKK